MDLQEVTDQAVLSVSELTGLHTSVVLEMYTAGWCYVAKTNSWHKIEARNEQSIQDSIKTYLDDRFHQRGIL